MEKQNDMDNKKELQSRKDEILSLMNDALETGDRKQYDFLAHQLTQVSKELFDDGYSAYRTTYNRGSLRKNLTISVSQVMYDKVKAECDAVNVNASKLVTELLISYFKKKDGGKE